MGEDKDMIGNRETRQGPNEHAVQTHKEIVAAARNLLLSATQRVQELIGALLEPGANRKQLNSFTDEELVQALTAIEAVETTADTLGQQVRNLLRIAQQQLRDAGKNRMANHLLNYGGFEGQNLDRPSYEKTFQPRLIALQILLRVIGSLVNEELIRRGDVPEVRQPKVGLLRKLINTALLLGLTAGAMTQVRPKDTAEAAETALVAAVTDNLEQPDEEDFDALCRLVLTQTGSELPHATLTSMSGLIQAFAQKLGPEVLADQIQTQLVVVCVEFGITPDSPEMTQISDEILRLAHKLQIEIPGYKFQLENDGPGIGPERPSQGGGVRVLELNGKPVDNAVEKAFLENLLNSDPKPTDNILIMDVTFTTTGPNQGQFDVSTQLLDEGVLQETTQLLGQYGLSALGLSGDHEIVVYFDPQSKSRELIAGIRLKSDLEIRNGDQTSFWSKGTLFWVHLDEANQLFVSYADPFLVPGGEATFMSVADVINQVGDNYTAKNLLEGMPNDAVILTVTNSEGVVRYLYSEDRPFFLGKNIVNESPNPLRIYSSPEGFAVIGQLESGSDVPVIEDIDADDYDIYQFDSSLLKYSPVNNIFATPMPSSGIRDESRIAVATLTTDGPAIGFLSFKGGDIRFEDGTPWPELSSDELVSLSSSETNPSSEAPALAAPDINTLEYIPSIESSTSTETVQSNWATPKNGNINIRSGKSTNDKVLDVLAYGDSLEIIGSVDGDWLQVMLSDGSIGYVSKSVVTVESKQETVDSTTTQDNTADILRRVESGEWVLTDVAMLESLLPTGASSLEDILSQLPSNVSFTHEGQTVTARVVPNKVVLTKTGGTTYAGFVVEFRDAQGNPVSLVAASLDLSSDSLEVTLESGFEVAETETSSATAEYQLTDEQFAAARRTVFNFMGETINPDSMVGAVGGPRVMFASTVETGFGYERSQFTDEYVRLSYAQMILMQLRLNGENPDFNTILRNIEQNGLADYQDLTLTISDTEGELGRVALGDLSVVMVQVKNFSEFRTLVDRGLILSTANWYAVIRYNPETKTLLIIEGVDAENKFAPWAPETQLESVQSGYDFMQLINTAIVPSDKMNIGFMQELGANGAGDLFSQLNSQIVETDTYFLNMVKSAP